MLADEVVTVRIEVMLSHTVPKKLLEHFAFDDPVTRSKRLWRYEKGRPPSQSLG